MVESFYFSNILSTKSFLQKRAKYFFLVPIILIYFVTIMTKHMKMTNYMALTKYTNLMTAAHLISPMITHLVTLYYNN